MLLNGLFISPQNAFSGRGLRLDMHA